jgi:hypothetical protein
MEEKKNVEMIFNFHYDIKAWTGSGSESESGSAMRPLRDADPTHWF